MSVFNQLFILITPVMLILLFVQEDESGIENMKLKLKCYFLDTTETLNPEFKML